MKPSFRIMTLGFIAGAAAVFAPGSAKAFVLLDYEGIGDFANINNFYNGGTDSLGNSGINYGVTFSQAALGLVDSDAAGGSGNFANEPSPNTIMFFLDASPYMNYTSGFTQFSTFYTTDTAGAFLEFFTGTNGTGTSLGTLSLAINNPGTPPCSGDPSGFYCNFTSASIILSGVAQSVAFQGNANAIGYDNTIFNPQLAPNSVPGPLPILGVAAAFGFSRKLRKRIKVHRDTSAVSPSTGS
jgi:hypothetical protein